MQLGKCTSHTVTLLWRQGIYGGGGCSGHCRTSALCQWTEQMTRSLHSATECIAQRSQFQRRHIVLDGQFRSFGHCGQVGGAYRG